MSHQESKKCGILMPIFSLPSKYGIGSLGAEAYRFVDFLVAAKHDFWQVLPLNPTSFGDSPYQSPSAFAGNPYFIDLDFLCKNGLLTEKECKAEQVQGRKIDYAKLYRRRIPVLYKAFLRFEKSKRYQRFIEDNQKWLFPYGKFMTLKELNGGKVWNEWKIQDAETDEFWYFVQFIFFRQWKALKTYANEHGIQIIGDMPIYVAYDSVDVWQNKSNFLLDKKGEPTEVAGVPPDAFSEKGQLWGNPLYDWDKMKRDGYKWWHQRIYHALDMYDYVRIDHFIGFVRYYCIPSSDNDARKGEWRKGPGAELFKGLEKENIVAEDLGLVTDEVRDAITETGYPGMKVLQHAFGGDSDCEHKPSNFTANNIVYTGTHDNETLFQKISSTKGTERAVLKSDLHRECTLLNYSPKTFTNRQICNSIISLLYLSKAKTVIVPLADILYLGGEGRINAPSTIGGNWSWTVKSNYRICKKRLIKYSLLRKITCNYKDDE